VVSGERIRRRPDGGVTDAFASTQRRHRKALRHRGHRQEAPQKGFRPGDKVAKLFTAVS